MQKSSDSSMNHEKASRENSLRLFHSKTIIFILAIFAIVYFISIQRVGPSFESLSKGPFADPPIRSLLEASQSKNEPRNCSPKHHLLFLKTHKCASTTIQNIFLRYGLKRNLTFALPLESNTFGIPQKFRSSMIPAHLMPPGGEVDIFCLHARLHQTNMKRVLHEDTIWLTILREPLSLFESLFSFYGFDDHYNIDLNELPKALEKFKNQGRLRGRIGRNQMIFDLGVKDNPSVTELEEAIEDLDNLFHLVMIVEKMDESLILLRDLLCWKNEDIVHLKLNVRQSKYKKNITLSTEKAIRKLNSADRILYNHFLAKHNLAVMKYGVEKMKDEIKKFRDFNDKLLDHCSAVQINGSRETAIKGGFAKRVIGFTIPQKADRMCQQAGLPERVFIEEIKRRQAEFLKLAKN